MPDFLRWRAVVPPLGLMYLAGYLRGQCPGRYDLRILDPGVERVGVETVRRRVAEFGADVAGLSGLSADVPEMLAIAGALHRTLPALRIVFGGPCTVSDAERLACAPGVAAAVIGEGEETFRELLDALETGRDLAEVDGLVFWNGSEVVRTNRRAPIRELDSLPHPAWDLIDVAAYSDGPHNMTYGIYKKKPYMAIFTSRGCPFHCTYCHGIFGHEFRTRSPENVLAEIEALSRRHGVREFHFFDDSFNLDAPRAKRIMDLIVERGLNVALCFPNGVRGDTMDEELLVKMARAGTYFMAFAIETASPRLQKYLRKNTELDRLARNIAIANREGIMALGFFMLGFPGETPEELEQTTAFACGLDLVYAYFFAVVPFEGTELARQLRERGDFAFEFDRRWTYHSMRPYYSQATGIDVTAYQRRAYLRFYSRPWRLARLFWLHPSKLLALKNFLKWLWFLLIVSSDLGNRLDDRQADVLARWHKA
jgi:radical SAM superfamily enzyme YgiQ (UPF0313 family)